MSQTYTDDCFDPAHSAQTDMANIEANFAALKSSFSGTSQPTNIVAGMWWHDETTHILKHRNEANTAWLDIWDMANNKPFIGNLSNEITEVMISSTTKDPSPATPGLRTLGSGSNQACAGDDPRLSIVNGTVSQAKLKTTTHSTSVTISTPSGPEEYESGSGTTGILGGGEYAFRTVHYETNSNMSFGGFTGSYRSSYTGLQGHFSISPSSGGGQSETGTGYIRERYVQSSGEVHWIFNLKNRETGLIEKSWQAPDHCCFGNGDDPSHFQHPYGDYDEDKYELIVINPPHDFVKKLKQKAGKIRDILEVINNEYEIDELSSPAWPTKAVTVGLPQRWEEAWHTGENVKTIKAKIPKPKQAVTRVLKKKK